MPRFPRPTWRECPTCTTLINVCWRCGADHPIQSFDAPRVMIPPGYVGTDSREDVRLCEKCRVEFTFLAHAWIGRPPSESLIDWGRSAGAVIPEVWKIASTL